MKRPEKKSFTFSKTTNYDTEKLNIYCKGYNQACDKWEKFLPNFDEVEKLVTNIDGVDKFHRAHNIANIIIERIGK